MWLERTAFGPQRKQNLDDTFLVYPRKLGGSNRGVEKLRSQNNLPSGGDLCDSTLTYHRFLRQWTLCLVYSVEVQTSGSENQANPGHVVALDPGNRTFATFWSPTKGIGAAGVFDINRLLRLAASLDRLVSQRQKVAARRRNRLKQAEHRLRRRIKNLRNDFHKKFASWLTREYDCIVVPPFNAHCLSRKGSRQISNKTVRGLMTWAHGSFRERLQSMAAARGKVVILQDEAYTSKTCSSCGWLDNKLKGKRVFACKKCGMKVDRDVNGARGIFLRALLDGRLGLHALEDWSE